MFLGGSTDVPGLSTKGLFLAWLRCLLSEGGVIFLSQGPVTLKVFCSCCAQGVFPGAFQLFMFGAVCIFSIKILRTVIIFVAFSSPHS